MNKILNIIFIAFILLGCKTIEKEAEAKKDKVFVNQIGYLPTEDKYFMVESYSGGFQVLDFENTPVYSGDLVLWKLEDESTGMDLYKGDFSDLSLTGTFSIKLDNGEESYPFEIGSDIYVNARNLSLKSYYYQRASMELKEEHAGRFKRGAGHVAKLKYHSSSSLTGEKDVNGGWYDAGDYGRYITPASVVLGLMMVSYEEFPEKYNFDNNNIPESGNGVSDFLDEMRYEMEWMLKMQYTGEGEFHGALPWMANSTDYVNVFPTHKSATQVIYDFSSVSTADFVAVMANAARNFKGKDDDFAKRCLEAALLAWDFVERNPDYPEGGFQNPGSGIPGGYGMSAESNVTTKDDITWAALELYLTTEDQKYHEKAKKGLNDLIGSWWGGLCWIDVSVLARLQYMLADESLVDMDLQRQIKDNLLWYCDYLVEISENDGFKTVLNPEDYYWGSNAQALIKAQMLIYGYELTGNEEYSKTALNQLNYIFGLNALGFSHVVDLGSNYPVNIYSAITANDDTYGAFPGLMTGGANRNLDNDYTLPKYFNSKTPPALCYIDHPESWSTNENCIGYNAPLVAVTAYFAN